MNDFSDLEKDLKAMRPARPSPVLFQRIDEGLDQRRKTVAHSSSGWNWQHFMEWCRGETSDSEGELVAAKGERASQNRLRFGIGFAAAVAALLLLLARIHTDQSSTEHKDVASGALSSALPQTAKAAETEPAAASGTGTKAPTVSDRFIPSGATQVVYNTRDEGLHFPEGSPQPVRRLRYRTQETCQWRNPSTGASLRVSYPSEEVVLIPVSGQ